MADDLRNAWPDLDVSDVIASTVHDIKNSLTVVLGSLDEMAGGCAAGSCPTHRGLYHLRYEGKRLNGSLIQLLSLYRMENGRYFLNVTENDLEECLEECGLENEETLATKGIRIDIECESGLIGYFDRELVMGVINTVTNNAYRYTKDRITLSAQQCGQFLRISVVDNGPGYPEEMLHRAGDGQVPVSFSTRSTGLGLYFAARVAAIHKNKEHRGYITTGNDGPDGGGCFSLFLP